MRLTGYKAATLAAFSVSTWGYILDDSCDPYKDLVVNGMKSAFDMASAARDALTALEKPGSGATYTAQKDLVTYVFEEALTNGNVDKSNSKWGDVQSRYTLVGFYDNGHNGQPETSPAKPYSRLHSTDLIVYCDYSRFEEDKYCDTKDSSGNTVKGKKEKGIVCDTSLNVNEKMSDLYKSCKSNSIFSSKAVQAVTTRYEGRDDLPRITQLCPPYVKEMQKAHVQSLSDTGKKPSLARKAKKLGDWMDDPFRTAMDVAYLFSSTLVHEMTHAVPGLETNDGDGKTDGYGWKNVNKLSNAGGTKSADSYAFFALAARMISPADGKAAQRPNKDGSIVALEQVAGASNTNNPNKRSGPNYPLRQAVDSSSTGSSFRVTSSSKSSSVVSSYDPDITLSVDHATVTLNASNATGFVVSAPSSTVTVLPSSIYTIGTDVVSLLSSGVVYDSSTVLFPRPANQTGVSSTRGNASSSGIIGTGQSSTFVTSTRSSSSSTGSSSGSTTVSRSSTISHNSTISQSSTVSHSSSSSQNSTRSSSVPSASGSSTSSGSVSYSTGTTTPPPNTSGVSSTTSGAFETIASGSTTTAVPITVIPVSKDGTTSKVTYVSTKTSSGDIGPTGAWVCSGPLCDTGGGCVVPLFCKSKPGGSASWGLCCGWNPPPASGGGSSPQPGGPDPPKNNDDNNPSTSDSNDSTKTDSQSSTKSSESHSNSQSSSSCTQSVTSSCDTTVSVFTPSGASTASSSTITGKCTTTTGCSISATASQTTTTAAPTDLVSAIEIGDSFLADDPQATVWYSKQQEVWASAMADTTDEYVVWSGASASSTSSGSASATASGSNSTSHSAQPSSTGSSVASQTSTSSRPSSSSSQATSSTTKAPSSTSQAPSSTTSAQSSVRACVGNQVEGPCTQASLPSAASDSGTQEPVCQKFNTDDWVRFNEKKASDAASEYCSNLVNDGVVLDAKSTAPKPGLVDGGENGGQISLVVMFDESGCDPGTKDEDEKVDFKAMGQKMCYDYLYTALATSCAQDPTWGDYNKDYTLEGGSWSGKCALWSMVGLKK